MDTTRQTTPPPDGHNDPLIDEAVKAYRHAYWSHDVRDYADHAPAHRAGVAAVVALMNERADTAARALKAVA